ncbi:MAG TPA: type II toxin-antitoxin system VapC family toxin [Actinomycetes bacterium]|nr:type II toxin-antitoxin system VapC family toxin [Actinomycetes bacterium]
MLYLDSSALAKLVVAEAETDALLAVVARSDAVVTCALATVEVVRAARLVDAALVPAARELVARLDQIPCSPDLLAEAGELQPAQLRSLDAIHLAAALRVARHGLEAFVAYDRRLLSAAGSHGLPVRSPA